jgi:hypothetical protein
VVTGGGFWDVDGFIVIRTDAVPASPQGVDGKGYCLGRCFFPARAFGHGGVLAQFLCVVMPALYPKGIKAGIRFEEQTPALVPFWVQGGGDKKGNHSGHLCPVGTAKSQRVFS